MTRRLSSSPHSKNGHDSCVPSPASWTPWTRRSTTGSPSRPTRICRAAPARWRLSALDCATAASTGCPSAWTRSNAVWPAASALTATGTVGSTSVSTPTLSDVSGSIPTSPPPRSPAPLHPAGGTPRRNATLTRGCPADQAGPASGDLRRDAGGPARAEPARLAAVSPPRGRSPDQSPGVRPRPALFLALALFIGAFATICPARRADRRSGRRPPRDGFGPGSGPSRAGGGQGHPPVDAIC